MTFKYISYTTRIWWLSVWLSPIIWGLSILIEEGFDEFIGVGEILGGYLIIILVATILSLPAYGIFILINELVFQNSDDIFVGKVIASFFGLAIAYLLFEAFFGGLLGESIFRDDETFAIVGAYSFTVLFGIWYYEPFPKT